MLSDFQVQRSQQQQQQDVRGEVRGAGVDVWEDSTEYLESWYWLSSLRKECEQRRSPG
jgi:hypothetical protein